MTKKIIFLEAMRFYAYHGVLEHESRIGNDFVVDVEIHFDQLESDQSDELAHTLDYMTVYEAIKSQMQIRSNLLEHLASNIIEKLILLEPSIGSIKLKIKKLNPPIGGSCVASGVIFEHKSNANGKKQDQV